MMDILEKYGEKRKCLNIFGLKKLHQAKMCLRVSCEHRRTISLDTIECINGEQRPGLYFANAHGRRHFYAARIYEFFGWV